MADALSRRALLVQEIQLQTIGIEALKGMHVEDEDFKDIYATCSQFNGVLHGDSSDFLI